MLKTTSFFIGHENLIRGQDSAMWRWRATLFILMSRNAANAGSFFSLPVDQVIEVGVRMEV